ncbi:MAG: hypothetical protein ACFB9M_21060 [Myxococcota bacterium]
MRSAWLTLAAILSSCGPGEVPIRLQFPNSEARDAVRRLTLSVYVDSVSSLSCDGDFSGTAARGERPDVEPLTQGDFRCAPEDQTQCQNAWFESAVRLEQIPSGRGIVYVRGFASVQADAAPVFEGCSDRFDTEGDALVTMRFVRPQGTRLELESGSSMTVADAFEIRGRVIAPDPRNAEGSRRAVVLPGYPVAVHVEPGGARLELEAASVTYRSRADGSLSILGRISESGVAMVGLSGEGLPDVQVRLTRLSPMVFSRIEVIPPVPGGRPVDFVTGDFDLDGQVDGALLSCGPDGACTLGELLVEPTEATAVSMLTVIWRLREPVPTKAQFGRVPVDLRLVDLPGEPARLVTLSARTSDCSVVACSAGDSCRCEDDQGVSCVCEASELSLWRSDGTKNLVVDSRYVTTGSTAVAVEPLMGMQDPEDVPNRFAVATRGRLFGGIACLDNCACPPGERCSPIDGACEDIEPAIEIATRSGPLGVLFDPTRCACRDGPLATDPGCAAPPLPFCEAIAPSFPERSDLCGRPIPPAVPAGPPLTTAAPRNLVTLDASAQVFVLGAAGGLDFVVGAGYRYTHRVSRRVNDRFDGLFVADIDPGLELEAPRPDLLYWSRLPCERLEGGCGLISRAEPRGCLGVLASSDEAAVSSLQLDLDSADVCRRFDLDFEPAGACSGDFDGNGATDLALSSASDGVVRLIRNDRFGGLGVVTDRLETDAEAGGPLDCRDIDADGLTDIVMVSRPDRRIWIFSDPG